MGVIIQFLLGIENSLSVELIYNEVENVDGEALSYYKFAITWCLNKYLP